MLRWATSRSQEADRRQAGVDDPHQRRSTLQLQRRARRRARRPRAACAEPASKTQQPTNAAASSGRSPRSSCGAPASTQDERGPDGVPGVGDREEQHAIERSRAAHPVRQPRQQQPGRHEQRNDARRHQHEHRDQHELRRHHVAAADRELDPGEQHVQRRRAPPRWPGRTRAVAPGTSSRPPAVARNSDGGDDLAHQLAPRHAPRARRPGVLEEPVGRRLAAHVVDCAHVTSVIGHRAGMQPPVARAAPRPPAISSAPRVRIDVDVVDRPGSAVVLRIEDDLHRADWSAFHSPSDLLSEMARRRLPRRCPCRATRRSSRSSGRRTTPAQLDVEHAPRAARAAREEPERRMVDVHAERRRDRLAGRLDRERLRIARSMDLVRLVAD